MRQPFFTKQFKKDLKRVKKSSKNVVILKMIMSDLIADKVLNPSYHDHALSGNWKDCRECHIQGNWLLIYKFVNHNKIYFERTGSHSELFG